MEGQPSFPLSSVVSNTTYPPLSQQPLTNGTPLPTTQGAQSSPITNANFPNLLGTFVPTILADNERGNLNWNRSNPPDASYKRIGVIGDGSCFFHAAVKALAGIYQLSYKRFSEISEDIIQKFENSINLTNLFHPTIFYPFRLTRQPGVQYIITNQVEYERSMQTFRTKFVQLLRLDFADKLQTDQRLRDVVARRLVGEIDVQASIAMSKYPNMNEVQAAQYGFMAVINGLIGELKSLYSVDARYALLLSDYYDVDIYVIIDREIKNPHSKNSVLSEYYNSAIQGPRNMRPPGDPNGERPSRPAFVIIHVNGGHFEIVGKVHPSGEFITTSFNSGDPFIRQLYSLLLTVRGVEQQR